MIANLDKFLDLKLCFKLFRTFFDGKIIKKLNTLKLFLITNLSDKVCSKSNHNKKFIIKMISKVLALIEY